MKRLSFFFLLFISIHAWSIDMFGVYPTHWWVGMKNNKLQLMLHGENIGMFTHVSINYPGVKVMKVTKSPDNGNYLFLDLTIAATAKPGRFKILLSGGGTGSEDVSYELKARNKENGKSRVMGVSAKDFIYLLIPDRFANGDASNDVVTEYRDKGIDRSSKFYRHGGDFKGITDHLNYFNQLGVTTLWLTPVIENDMPMMDEWGNKIAGYHGYWFTNHYEIDKRLGGNEGYKKFCNDLHNRGMKVIQDAVYNHVGNHHWFALDPPTKDWINNWPAFKGTNHREEVFYDPYASSGDKKIMTDGWFIEHLPDLNLRNPFVATFLIQHAIWTTEEYGIDGWRVDTYKYCDEQFMNNVNTALEREFPHVTIFGESWVNSPVANAYFTRNNINAPFKHNAEGMLDFQLAFAMLAGMNENFGWTAGMTKIYMTLAQDVLYKNPMNNCIFLDNHDMDRVYSTTGEEWKKLKMGINWLLTMRGIPQLYYGTEVLMKNFKTSLDGATVREDFPGGWPEDKPKDNAFTQEGRSDKQNEAFDHISRLANFRKTSSALTAGKTMQFIPDNGLYVYFRYDDKQTVMVITNTGDKDVKPDWSRFAERMKGFTQVRNVISGKIIPLNDLSIDSKNSFVFELLK